MCVFQVHCVTRHECVTERCPAADLFSLRDVDRVHRTGADLAALILKEQHAGQELGVLVVSIQDSDGETGAGVEVLRRVHLLTRAKDQRGQVYP